MTRIGPIALLLAFTAGAAPAAAPTAGPQLDTARIEQLTGLKGTYDAAAGVFKISAPRGDLSVTVGGVKMSPFMGLTSWAAFMNVGSETMVMGDMTLHENQVNAVMSAALDAGLAVTALHNHFLWDSPRVMFMHISGMGATDALATAVGAVFRAIDATRRATGPHAGIDTTHSAIDAAPLESILGATSTAAHGIAKFTFGRTTAMHDHELGSAMGVNTWAAFAGTNAAAIVDGDFVMLESELQGVLKALRGGGINVVAIHNHMTQESPRMMFLHYWGTGAAADLATTLKAALATQSGT